MWILLLQPEFELWSQLPPTQPKWIAAAKTSGGLDVRPVVSIWPSLHQTTGFHTCIALQTIRFVAVVPHIALQMPKTWYGFPAHTTHLISNPLPAPSRAHLWSLAKRCCWVMAHPGTRSVGQHFSWAGKRCSQAQYAVTWTCRQHTVLTDRWRNWFFVPSHPS